MIESSIKINFTMLPLNLVFPKAKLLLVLAYFLPVILLFWFVIAFSVNVPFWDEWELVDFFGKVHNGTVTFGDFFAQQNEHRIFFPRVIFVIIAFSSKWNIKLEICFSLLLCLASFLILYKLSDSNYHQSNKLLFHLFNIATCIIFFSLIQHENWLWGFQIAWFLINICLIAAIFILSSSGKPISNYQIAFASLCCFIASFSSAHGLLSWLAIFPSIYLVKGESKQKKNRFLVLLLLFIFCVTLYSIGYQKPANGLSIFFVLQHPLIAFQYFFTLVGSSFCKGVFPPVITGLIVFLAFLFFNIFYFSNYRSDFASEAAPWLSLGWFATLFALITTIGRAGLGVEQAAGTSRYTTVLILLFISCLQLWRLWILDKWQSYKETTIYFSWVKLCLGFLIALLIFDSISSIIEGRSNFTRRNAGKTCLEVVNFMKYGDNTPNNCLNFLYPDQSVIRIRSKALESLGFRYFPRNINFISKRDGSYGYIDFPTATKQILSFHKNNALKLSGWAIFPEQKEQPSTVLLSYGKNQLFFANGIINLSRPDVDKALKSSQYHESGWEANISLKHIPIGETTIKAWVYDKKHQQFTQLNGEPRIKIVE